MRNRTYGGVRGRKTKVGRKLLRFPPTRFYKIAEFLPTQFRADYTIRPVYINNNLSRGTFKRTMKATIIVRSKS